MWSDQLLQRWGVTTNASHYCKTFKAQTNYQTKTKKFKLVGYSKHYNFAQVDDNRSKPFV